MATLVIFVEHAITHRLLNGSVKYTLRKGRATPQTVLDGIHEDTMVLAALTALQSLFGLPWLTAATVRSISHVQALQVNSSGSGGGGGGDTSSNKGTKQPQQVTDGVLEQRVTNIAIHSVLGALVVLRRPRQWLTQTVPPAALMGLVCLSF
jgi:hypothetical protein